MTGHGDHSLLWQAGQKPFQEPQLPVRVQRKLQHDNAVVVGSEPIDLIGANALGYHTQAPSVLLHPSCKEQVVLDDRQPARHGLEHIVPPRGGGAVSSGLEMPCYNRAQQIGSRTERGLPSTSEIHLRKEVVRELQRQDSNLP